MKYLTKLLLSTVVIVPLATAAQSSSEPLSLPYESVFKQYQTHADVPLRDWKTSNEAARRAGGWRQYLKESQAPDSLNVLNMPDTTKPSAVDHSKHTQQTNETKKP